MHARIVNDTALTISNMEWGQVLAHVLLSSSFVAEIIIVFAVWLGRMKRNFFSALCLIK